MQKIFFIVVLFVAFGLNVSAQSGGHQMPPAEQRAQNQTERLAQALKLNDGQKTLVYQYTLTAVRAMDSVRATGDKQSMRAIKQNKDAQIKTVLTSDQYNAYLQLEQQQMEKMKQRRMQNMGGSLNNTPQN